ncbi:MDMPI N domain containing protein [Streptomyces sp. GC420]|nr:MDMPI N domain containing protein [Streptomyces sp. GC420]
MPPQRRSFEDRDPSPFFAPIEPRPAPGGGTHPQEAIPTVPEPAKPPVEPPALEHKVLKSLLGAWALSACSAEEAAAVELHLGECAPCAEEALRLRDAVGLLQREDTLDLDPQLRSKVLGTCLDRRPARIPVPEWVVPYDTETARLDALLRDIGDVEWHAPVRLRWFEGERQVGRKTTVAGVIAHLMTVDGLVATALGLDDPLGDLAPEGPGTPRSRTEALWKGAASPPTGAVHRPWREQSHTLVRTICFAGRSAADLTVAYGDFGLPLRDSMLDRAFECWLHADDIAGAIDYPYGPPAAGHLNSMIDLAARHLPVALAERRRAGLAGPARSLVEAGTPGRTLHLEIEGPGGGDWYIPLDSPAAVASPAHAVAQVAMDGEEFCRLVAGQVPPDDPAAGGEGDKAAIRDVMFAAASMSRL